MQEENQILNRIRIGFELNSEYFDSDSDSNGDNEINLNPLHKIKLKENRFTHTMFCLYDKFKNY